MLKVALKNSPNPAIRIIAMTAMAETPREIALFASGNLGHLVELVIPTILGIHQAWIVLWSGDVVR